jgi:type I restriction enzyme S subunit
MNSDWSRQRLGNLIDIKHGFAFKGEYFSETPTLFQLTTPGNFAIGGGFQVGKGKFYSGPIPDDFILKSGDLLVTMTDLSKAADSLGYSAVVPEIEGTTWLHNQRVGLISIKTGAPVSFGFLHYLMRSSDYRHWVVSTATGSTVKHTSPSRICEYEFLLPPIENQIWISEILGAIDDRINQLGEINKTLESIAQALFKSWFVDFDPVRAKAEGKLPEGIDAATAALFPEAFEESELGLVPKGWTIKTLGDITERITKGTTPTTLKRPFVTSGINFVKAESMTGDGGFIPNKFAFIDEETHQLLNRSQLKAGDILISIAGTIGRIAVMRDEFLPANTNQAVAILRSIPKIFPGELINRYLRLEATQRAMNEKVVQAVQANLSLGTLSSLKLSIPPEGDIEKLFNSGFAQIEKSWTANEQRVMTLTGLRDTLLPRLISGRLRIADIEAELEKATA